MLGRNLGLFLFLVWNWFGSFGQLHQKQTWLHSFFVGKIHLKSRADFLNNNYIACPQCLVTVKYEANWRMSSGFISSKILSSKDLFILWICNKKEKREVRHQWSRKTKSSLEVCISYKLLNTASSELCGLFSLQHSAAGARRCMS